MIPPPLADPERALALAYVPPAARPAVQVLWALDEALGTIVARAREHALAQIRLIWWRDALCALGGGASPPVDPLLRALDAMVVPRTGGAALAPIAEGWGALLGEPDEEALRAHARARGEALFAATAMLLGADFADIPRAGRLWSAVDAARRLGGEDADAALGVGRGELGEGAGARWPIALRPLGMLAALAARDARRGVVAASRGAPGRVARMVAHRLTGRAGLGDAPRGR